MVDGELRLMDFDNNGIVDYSEIFTYMQQQRDQLQQQQQQQQQQQAKAA